MYHRKSTRRVLGYVEVDSKRILSQLLLKSTRAELHELTQSRDSHSNKSQKLDFVNSILTIQSSSWLLRLSLEIS